MREKLNKRKKHPSQPSIKNPSTIIYWHPQTLVQIRTYRFIYIHIYIYIYIHILYIYTNIYIYTEHKHITFQKLYQCEIMYFYSVYISFKQHIES